MNMVDQKKKNKNLKNEKPIFKTIIISKHKMDKFYKDELEKERNIKK